MIEAWIIIAVLSAVAARDAAVRGDTVTAVIYAAVIASIVIRSAIARAKEKSEADE